MSDLRPDCSHLQGERDRAFSERWLRAPRQPDPFGSVAITLTNLDGGFISGLAWRRIGITKFAVSFSPASHSPAEPSEYSVRSRDVPPAVERPRPCRLQTFARGA
jgi:hypothetical protein